MKELGEREEEDQEVDGSPKKRSINGRKEEDGNKLFPTYYNLNFQSFFFF